MTLWREPAAGQIKRLIPLTQVTATMAVAADFKAAEDESNPWLPSWSRRESGWKLEWRGRRQHEGIVSSGEVNGLSDGLCGEGLPAVDLSHVGLS